MLKSLNKHKLGVNLRDVVKNPSTNLILQLEFIVNTIDSLTSSNNINIDDAIEDELDQ